MYKINKELNRSNLLSDTGLTCVLKNGQSIIIPKSIRETISLMAGDEVTIGFTNCSNELEIRKNNGDSLENKMIISERGQIWVPIELRTILSLEKGDVFQIYVSYSTLLIKLKKVQ